MKIGGDHDRRLGDTLRDRPQWISEPQGFQATWEDLHYPSPRGGGGRVGVEASRRRGGKERASTFNGKILAEVM
jgi:hypothetical protein